MRDRKKCEQLKATISGVISIGSIAVSTALSGYLLTKFNPSSWKALLFLTTTWSIIVVTYLIGAMIGCDEPQVKQLLVGATDEIKSEDNFECNSECHCGQVDLFNPVNCHKKNYFSPCHAGCREYKSHLQQWDLCSCADNAPVETGLHVDECYAVFIYLAIMFMGLFFGNLFFMTTVMIVLKSVHNEERILALSFASCITNIMDFIPSPLIFGWIIDEDCLPWHSKCPCDRGNCVNYDNEIFRQNFHFRSAGIQFLAVISVFICYSFSRKFIFPEEKEEEKIYQNYLEKQVDDPTLQSQIVEII